MSDQQKNKSTIEKQDQVLFIMLIQQHHKIALMGLGEEANPVTGAKEKDLKAVKYAIDTLTMLKKFMQGNLTEEMSDYLESNLKELRDKLTNTGMDDEHSPSDHQPVSGN